ncbi:hypothetical protein HRbin17_02177 [bacterium HR17]|uniref:Uncharacterized protein n=1 Tax=Candidatus Fervidibacter japonicus TaxID=2035412 RepID=A0A2H5XEN1_9BACT|nr:hypothetical protein HRbin17_02177 [bacterium HR17]
MPDSPQGVPTEPLSVFDCRAAWQGTETHIAPGAWEFGSGAERLILSVTTIRVQWQRDGQPLGWSQLLPPLGTRPTVVQVRRVGWRWLAFFHRHLVAFAFADVPPTERIASQGNAPIPTLYPLTPSQQWQWRPPDSWQPHTLSDGSVGFAPPLQQRRSVFVLSPTDTALTDIAVTAEVCLNAGRGIGVAIGWGDDGGHVWRWRREGSDMRVQLVAVARSGDEWSEQVLYDEPLPLSPLHWQRLQVWRSGDQLWVGLDGEVLAFCQDARFAMGQVGVWAEKGETPSPLVRSFTIASWQCATLAPSTDTATPLPSRHGQWRFKGNVWTLQKTANQDAMALLGDAVPPCWWVADIFWQGTPVGLVWGWRSEDDWCLLSLTPTSAATTVTLCVRRRDGEVPLARERVWLQPNALYRIAVRLDTDEVTGLINGIPFVRAKGVTRGKVGLWAKQTMTLKQFWLLTDAEMLLPLTPDDGGTVQPAADAAWIAHEAIAFTLPAGLPPGVPQTARLSQAPVTLWVERTQHRLQLRLDFNDRLLVQTSVRQPLTLPLAVRLERRDRWVLVWLGERLVLTAKLP